MVGRWDFAAPGPSPDAVGVEPPGASVFPGLDLRVRGVLSLPAPRETAHGDRIESARAAVHHPSKAAAWHSGPLAARERLPPPAAPDSEASLLPVQVERERREVRQQPEVPELWAGPVQVQEPSVPVGPPAVAQRAPQSEDGSAGHAPTAAAAASHWAPGGSLQRRPCFLTPVLFRRELRWTREHPRSLQPAVQRPVLPRPLRPRFRYLPSRRPRSPVRRGHRGGAAGWPRLHRLSWSASSSP
jgi:hypothetical protein